MKILSAFKNGAGSDFTGWKQKLRLWGYLGTFTLLAVYFAVFMQWLYQVTKPSFMDSLNVGAKVGVMLLSGLALTLAILPVFLILSAASLLPWRSRAWKGFLWIAALIPAFFLAVTALSMIDNFTYTIFHFGIVTTKGTQRGLYGAIMVVLLAYIYIRILHSLTRQSRISHPNGSLRAQLYSSAAIVLISIPLSAGLYASSRPPQTTDIPVTGQAARTPNILLIGTDALRADHMSVYGYSRDTTPFLKTLAQQSLVSTNNFPNASISAGSFASIFTGKLPTTTRVLFPPNTLRGADAVQHFPGILKDQGYYTAEISVDYYADANQFHLVDGFYTINSRSATIPVFDEYARRVIPEDANYFLSTNVKQISDRLLHIFYIRTYENPLDVVYQGLTTVTDQQRIGQTIDIFRNAQQPVFVNVYMLSTHMGILTSQQQVFSKGEQMNDSNWGDFYDDAILSFDSYMNQVVSDLKAMGKLDQTIIIIYSDHGWMDVSNERIPLIIRFPNGQYAGTMTNNTQNLDIAPTLLDYLGIPKPSWMAGQSLLKGQPPFNRPVFSAVPGHTFLNNLNQLEIDPKKAKAPFYQFGTIGMVVCQNWYSLNTDDLSWHKTAIENYPTPCPANALPSDRQAEQMIINQLQLDGFDVSGLMITPEMR